MSSSRQLPDQARLYFLSCSDLAVLTLHLPACFTSVLHFSKSPLVSQSRVQSRITFLLHTLDQIFTLSHIQPIHYSHLNIGFLNVELQANLAQNKANTQLNKFNFTKFDNSLLKQLDLTFQVTKLIKLISIEYFISHKRDSEFYKVEFIQSFLLALFHANLLIIQHLEILYLGGNHLRVVMRECEEKLKSVHLRRALRLVSRQRWHTCEACRGAEESRQLFHYRTKLPIWLARDSFQSRGRVTRTPYLLET